jgi:hypothetical protein
MHDGSTKSWKNASNANSQCQSKEVRTFLLVLRKSQFISTDNL